MCQLGSLDFDDQVRSGAGAEHVTNCRLPSDNWRFPCFNRMCIVKISKMTKSEEMKKEKYFLTKHSVHDTLFDFLNAHVTERLEIELSSPSQIMNIS